ncbi:IS256 family transposase [Rudanella paleaurantiibacter]|jgi:transposase-like protein|uniref:Mutator family transposase n=1 Tax=Rudanella paleaurantiibacter TaxID=2614655 RepID=A0A7J5TRL0_9BACT|nr:IS256 family transposase [Rudanella paleaurantiibacter]KAB7725160.1 IS256 family transposase [Rudanella paleaurantiibacter]
MTDSFDYEAFKKAAIKGLYDGKPLTGQDGLFAPLLKHFLESALDGEMENHLAESRPQANRRNGKTTKTVKSSAGLLELTTPRDRAGSYQPQLVPKRQVVLTDQLEAKILSLYGRGCSYADISQHLQEMYGYSLSDSELTSITDKVLPAMRDWQNRPLASLYVLMWLDGIYYKVRQDGKVVTRVLYSVIGLTLSGRKQVLGIYTAESESARFWLTVLTDLKQRGVEDILISCVDGLKGFDTAINTVFPRTTVQLCIVHQLRNSFRFIPDKHLKEFVKAIKTVYQAPTAEQGWENLQWMQEQWGSRYPQALAGWVSNWSLLSSFYDYPASLRKVVYTTNTVEAYHRQLRKVTKTKGAFASDVALQKLVYLVIQNLETKWETKTYNWKEVINDLTSIFEERIKPHRFD